MKYGLFKYLFLLCGLWCALHAAGQKGMHSRSPYGLYVLNDQLKEVFAAATIKPVSTTIFNSLKSKTFYRAAYLVTVSDFSPVWTDLKALRDFAEEGNHVLIAASGMNEEAADFFHIRFAGFYSGVADSVKLTDPSHYYEADGKYFKSKILEDHSWIQIRDSSKITVLGVNGAGKPNFIRISAGSGFIYIHSAPLVFTNYFLLDKKNYTYSSAILSYLPENTGEVLWKTGTTKSGGYEGNAGELAFMGFIWGDDNLRSAFLLMLAALALLIAFGVKRRQRIIPELKPVTNTTLEFAQTMGDLYFNHRSNTSIAHKKIQYWQEYVRNTFHIPTHTMDAGFWALLSRKSGAGAELLRQLELYIVRARNTPNLNDRDLIHLNNCIDQFYKT